MKTEYDKNEQCLTIDVKPLPATRSTGQETEAWIASEPDELRELVRSLLGKGVERAQVRINLTELADGFLEVCGADSGDAFEARQSARYLRRAAMRLDRWADRVDPRAAIGEGEGEG